MQALLKWKPTQIEGEGKSKNWYEDLLSHHGYVDIYDDNYIKKIL